jgi:hypothetical protein
MNDNGIWGPRGIEASRKNGWMEKEDAVVKVWFRGFGDASRKSTISDTDPSLGVRGPSSLGVPCARTRCSPEETRDGVESVEEDADPLMSDGARDQLKRERSSPVNCENEVLHVFHSLLSKGGDWMVPVGLDFSASRCSRGSRLYTHSSDLLFSKHGIQGRFASHLCAPPSKQNKRRVAGVKGDELTRFLVLTYRARRSKQGMDQISNRVIRLVAPHSAWTLTDTVYTPLPSSKCSPAPRFLTDT